MLQHLVLTIKRKYRASNLAKRRIRMEIFFSILDIQSSLNYMMSKMKKLKVHRSLELMDRGMVLWLHF